MEAETLAARVHRRWGTWMYRTGRPNRLAAAMNRFWQAAASAGIWPGRPATLQVRGRSTGKPIRLPVVIADYGAQRYLVAMLGANTSWTANVRAAGGNALLHHGQYEAVRLREIDVARRAPIIRRYLQIAPGARPHIPVSPHASLHDFDAIAARYPVFRIDPARPFQPIGNATTGLSAPHDTLIPSTGEPDDQLITDANRRLGTRRGARLHAHPRRRTRTRPC
jgi:hypothetical protein